MSNYIAWSEVSNYIAWSEVSNHIAWSEVSNHIAWSEVSNYIAWSEVSNYIAWSEVNNYIQLFGYFARQKQNNYSWEQYSFTIILTNDKKLHIGQMFKVKLHLGNYDIDVLISLFFSENMTNIIYWFNGAPTLHINVYNFFILSFPCKIVSHMLWNNGIPWMLYYKHIKCLPNQLK